MSALDTITGRIFAAAIEHLIGFHGCRRDSLLTEDLDELDDWHTTDHHYRIYGHPASELQPAKDKASLAPPLRSEAQS